MINKKHYLKRSEIISRITELVRQKRVNGKLDLLSYDYPDYKIERLLFMRGGKLYYCFKKITTNIWNNTYQEREISKLKLDEKDRSSVVNDITLQDYAYINNKLGIQFKKK